MTFQGGSNWYGVLFVYDPATTTYTKLYDFSGSDGAYPYGTLTVYNGKLYGMTNRGGSNDKGVTFSLDPVTNNYTKLFDFTGSNGAAPVYGQFVAFPCALSATALVSSSTLCVGGVVSLSAAVVDNAGAPAFAWQGSAGVRLGQPVTASAVSATLNQTGPQTFTVTVTDGGCSATATISVTAVATPSSPTLTNSVSQLTACEGGGVSLSVSCDVGQAQFSTDARFSSFTVGNSIATPTAVGSYSYVVRCINLGCISSSTTVTATVYANPAAPSITTNGLLTCAVHSVTLTATSGFASYTFSQGATPLIELPNQATVSSCGTYSVVVANAYGCSASASTTVVAGTDAPDLSVSAMQGGIIDCQYPLLTLTASSTTSSVSFVFGGPGLVNQQPTGTASVSLAGTYSVTVTGANGCTAIATTSVAGSTTGVGPVSAQFSGVLSAAHPTVIISATSVGATSYLLIGPNTTSSNSTGVFLVSQEGSYQIIASNGVGSGCSASTTVQVKAGFTYSAPVLLSSTPLTLTVLAQGIRFVFVGPGGYVFSNVYRQAGQYLAYADGITQPGQYTLTVYGEDGSSASVVIDVVVPPKGMLWVDPLSGDR